MPFAELLKRIGELIGLLWDISAKDKLLHLLH